jgi:hypothetical protein
MNTEGGRRKEKQDKERMNQKERSLNKKLHPFSGVRIVKLIVAHLLFSSPFT